MGQASSIQVTQPAQAGATATEDGRTISFLFQGFEVRLPAGSGGQSGAAVAQIAFPLPAGATGGSISLECWARYGGVLPAGAEVQLSLLTGSGFAQKLLTAEDLEGPGPEWTTRVSPGTDFPMVQALLLLTVNRQSDSEELLFQWDSMDILIGA